MNEFKKYLSIIDHTLLRQDATLADVKNCCNEAISYGFYSVITQPYYIKEVSKILEGSKVLCGAVIGFPFGTELTAVKQFQTELAVKEGANEIDMVISMSAFKNGNYSFVENDINRVVKTANVPVKVIIETSFLNKEEIIKACKICINGGAAFVKTSTGYFGAGATVENIKIMKEACDNKIKIKGAGGIRTFEDLKAIADAGADRIGTSGGVSIANKIDNLSGY